jgi:hypothetical protein
MLFACNRLPINELVIRTHRRSLAIGLIILTFMVKMHNESSEKMCIPIESEFDDECCDY